MKPKKLGAVLKEIHTKRGRLTPALVVKEASNPASPLHDMFDWDDASAAHKHRLDYAARLIRTVYVVLTSDEGSIKVREWHAVRAAGVIDAPEGYLPNEDVAQTPIFRQAMLQQMTRDWKALEMRYQHLREFWSLVNSAARKRTRTRKRKKAVA